MLALALILWCAGTGCMMVSYARAAASDSSATGGALEHAMAGSMSMDAHACCKAKRSSKKTAARRESRTANGELNLLTTPSLPAPAGVMNCCPLTTGSIVLSSSSQSHDDATVVQQAKSASFLLVKPDIAPQLLPLRLPNRAHSYLLDCAFLI